MLTEPLFEQAGGATICTAMYSTICDSIKGTREESDNLAGGRRLGRFQKVTLLKDIRK